MKKPVREPSKPLYIVLISVHGLIRGHDLELGRDADTGGQTKYVVELARALGERDDVEKVILLTRRVIDEPGRARLRGTLRGPVGKSGHRAHRVRRAKISAQGDVVGFAGELFRQRPGLSEESGAHCPMSSTAIMPMPVMSVRSFRTNWAIPLVHTGHSLGRTKRKQLLASGIKRSEIETAYNISRRIEAEETTLGVAERVITSTQQEIEQQYGLYDFYQPDRMRVIPPGTDMEKFFPPQGNEKDSDIATRAQALSDATQTSRSFWRCRAPTRKRTLLR